MVSTAASEDGCPEGFAFQLLPTHDSIWAPDEARITLNTRLDARLVPSPASPRGIRLAYSHVVVLDSFVGETEREFLLSQLTESGWEHAQGPPAAKWERETADTHMASRTWGLRDHMLRQLAEEPSQAMLEINTRLARLYPEYDIALMPAEHMQSTSLDHQSSSRPSAQATQNVKHAEHLQSTSLDHRPSSKPLNIAEEHLAIAPSAPSGKVRQMASTSAAAAEAWLQADTGAAERGSGAHVKMAGGAQEAQQAQQNCSVSRTAASDSEAAVHGVAAYCAAFVGNAPVHGDNFCYHVDADPAGLPPSRWTDSFGDYVNGEPGQPLLVSMLLYLDDQWPRDWGAETLFLDDETDVGLVVRPKRGRAVLMDQDVLHRVSAPSAAAGGRPRYSLVWKLVQSNSNMAFLPKNPGQQCCLARPEWGVPTSIGSAARVEGVKQSLNMKRPRQEEGNEATPEGVLATTS